MQSEVDSLKQRISELEAKNAELLKQVTEESTKREAENVELKARIAKLEQIAEENSELKDRITKLEQKQTQATTNEQEIVRSLRLLPVADANTNTGTHAQNLIRLRAKAAHRDALANF
ncbi:8250_t:CDS:2 [Paraglomus occultum]|uniref:8250_t:CDS:1 n=1 Tax=Paraglomus occultum TaxID=144539 RepID=A0A9N9G8N1_9GLOM|nr:8250_t:CDS:2 [Paraglomus occultum]